jgi:hypothetical protein
MKSDKMTVENWSKFTKEINHDPNWIEDKFVYCEKCLRLKARAK